MAQVRAWHERKAKWANGMGAWPCSSHWCGTKARVARQRIQKSLSRETSAMLSPDVRVVCVKNQSINCFSVGVTLKDKVFKRLYITIINFWWRQNQKNIKFLKIKLKK